MGEARRRFQMFGGKTHKTGVLVCLPSHRAYNHTAQVGEAYNAGLATARQDVPYDIGFYPLLYRYPVSDARNECTQFFVEKTKFEYLYFWDHDMIPPENWMDLVGKGDIVSGWTLMWDGSRPAQKRIQANHFIVNEKNTAETLVPSPQEAPHEVDIVGTACMVIHRRVFERLGPRPFKEPVGPDGKRMMGEDMAFCREARAAGFKVTIIPSVRFNHVKEVGLIEVYEAMLAYAEFGRRAGYQQAVAEIQAAASGAPAPTLAQEMAQAGGAA